MQDIETKNKIIELTNKYTKDIYTGYEKRCDKHYIREKDILRISEERGEDIESYWRGRYKQNYYVYCIQNGETIRIQIDFETFNNLKLILGVD